MPPDLDIYVLVKNRDKETLERFIDAYVDRNASEDRGDEELMMLPLWLSNEKITLEDEEGLSSDDYDWELAQTLTNILERGLHFPRRAFSVYLKPKEKHLSGATLSFTADNQLILGLSIDDEGALPENEKQARKILTKLMQQFNGKAGLIIVEWPPPTTELDFMIHASHQFTMHFKTAGKKDN